MLVLKIQTPVLKLQTHVVLNTHTHTHAHTHTHTHTHTHRYTNAQKTIVGATQSHTHTKVNRRFGVSATTSLVLSK